MLRDEIALYTELSGNDGQNTPIGIIGAYLDGYEKGKSDVWQGRCKDCKYHEDEEPGMVYCPDRVGGWVSEDFFCKDGGKLCER